MKHVGTRVNAKDVASQEQLIEIVASQIHATANKSTPADTDEFGIADSAASWGLKKLTWANIKAALASLFVSKSGGTVAGNLTVQGSLMTTVGPLGYGPGAGGSVTQATSKTTAVTLNKPSGQILMHAGNMNANESVTFMLYSTAIGSSYNDVVVVTPVATANYDARSIAIDPGVVYIRVTNISGISKAEAISLNFAVIKTNAS